MNYFFAAEIIEKWYDFNTGKRGIVAENEEKAIEYLKKVADYMALL